jgi:carbonic anhydrase
MHNLVKGIHQFQANIFSSQRELFERLVEKQTPDALFITCSDSRINPNELTQTGPGELFILRNAGNVIPPYGAASSGEAATIEYALSALDIGDIIVCGHSHCGAMTALYNPDEISEMPAVRAWLAHAEATRRIVKENYGDLEPSKRLSVTIQENVLVQLENLRTHPAVAARVARGRLHLHGWVYQIDTGRVFAYDRQAEDFVPIGPEVRAIDPSRKRVRAVGAI